MKRRSTPPPAARPRWEIRIEPIEHHSPIDRLFGNWRVYLVAGALCYGGHDGWGWTAYTLRGAHRLARRLARAQLIAINARERRHATRTALERNTR